MYQNLMEKIKVHLQDICEITSTVAVIKTENTIDENPLWKDDSVFIRKEMKMYTWSTFSRQKITKRHCFIGGIFQQK